MRFFKKLLTWVLRQFTWPLKKLIALVVLFSLFQINALAKTAKVDPILKSPNYAGFVMNATSGKVLFSKNATLKRYPASLTKMMTLYLTFDAIEAGRLKLNQNLKISHHAARQGKVKLFLNPKETIKTKEAIYALIVRSANDAAVVLAEAVAGTEKKFVSLMNAKARQLGMKSTRFANSNGFHNPRQYTNARDMARLAIALQKNHKKFYPMFSRTSFVYKNKIIRSHNNVMYRYKGADGLKTGYINAAGYNLVTSAKKPEGRLIGVVMGGQTANIRDNHMIRLLETSFAKLTNSKKRKTTIVAQKPQKTSAFSVLDKKSAQKTSNNAFEVLDIMR